MRARNVSLAALVATLSLAAACTGDAADEGHVHDDAELGDSLPEGEEGKADGYTVPKTLGLDRNKVVYLTFDDGPSATNTPRILDVLAEHDVKATFFVTGTSISGNEAILRRAAAEGHIIANHQWRHVVATPTLFRIWVTQERDLLRAVVGEQPLYFRYPYGAMSATKESILKAAGYVDGGVGWDIDSLDWDFGPDGQSTRAEVPAHLRRDFEGWIFWQLERRGGGVILFHDVQSLTANRLDGILDELEARGYTVGQLPRQRAFIGDACAADNECAYAGAFCARDGEDEGVCTQACTSSCPDRAGYATTRCIRATDGDGSAMDVCARSCSSDADCEAGTRCETRTRPSGSTTQACW